MKTTMNISDNLEEIYGDTETSAGTYWNMSEKEMERVENLDIIWLYGYVWDILQHTQNQDHIDTYKYIIKIYYDCTLYIQIGKWTENETYYGHAMDKLRMMDNIEYTEWIHSVFIEADEDSSR